MATRRITSRQNAIVTRFRAIARGDDRTMMLLDGPHLVADALAARTAIDHAIVGSNGAAHPEIGRLVERLTAAGIDVDVASPPVMAAVSPLRSPSVLVAVAPRPASANQEIYGERPPFVVIACDIQDPGNLGAIVRVAEAGGATAVVAAGSSADPFGWKALRGSMGSALRLPIGVRSTPLEAVAEARSHGCRIVATAPRDGRPLAEADLTDRLAILIGAEGSGLEPGLIDAADERVTIPMRPPVESLNVAVTAAILVYEARRQRAHELAVS